MDEAAEAIGRAKIELEHAVVKGELSNDPLRFAFGGIAAALDAFLVGICVVHQPFDQATFDRLTTQAAAAAGDGARREVVRLSRVVGRRTSIAVGAAVSAAIAVCVAVGFLWGRSNEASRSAATFQAISERLQDGSTAAGLWLNLMRSNDIIEAVGRCRGRAEWVDAGGRRACAVPLWLQPSPSISPPKPGQK